MSFDPKTRSILDGFQLIRLTLKNASTDKTTESSNDWGRDVFIVVKQVHVPVEMVTFPSVGCEIVFSTINAISEFRIEQQVIVHGKTID
jgi:hypothetical protein